MENKKYYSERIGSERIKLSLKDLNEVFLTIVSEFADEQFFYDFYGYEDNFRNWTPGKAGRNFEAYCLSQIGRRIKDPFYQTTAKYSEEEIFNLIELLHEHICLKSQIAFRKFEYDTLEEVVEYSKQTFRDRINMQIHYYSIGWELTGEGYIREMISNELQELVNNTSIYGDENNVDSRIRGAIKQFLKYGAKELDKKGALIEIGGALEYIRKELEDVIPKEEVNDIFNLLNNFDLRHNNTLKKNGYDTAIYYPWMFYIFISTFDAFVKMRQRIELK